jgi:hypothetical protein
MCLYIIHVNHSRFYIIPNLYLPHFRSVGGLLEADGRYKFDAYLRTLDKSHMMPKVQAGETIYEYFVSASTGDWALWRPPKWEYPHGVEKIDFSNLLVPTMDSTRACYNMTHMHKQKKAICMVGGEGTAKTSTALMFFRSLDPADMLIKRYIYIYIYINICVYLWNMYIKMCLYVYAPLVDSFMSFIKRKVRFLFRFFFITS